MFTEKHYKAIADIIAAESTRFDITEEDDTEGKLTCMVLAGKLAEYFGKDNPRFDRGKFLSACLGD